MSFWVHARMIECTHVIEWVCTCHQFTNGVCRLIERSSGRKSIESDLSGHSVLLDAAVFQDDDLTAKEIFAAQEEYAAPDELQVPASASVPVPASLINGENSPTLTSGANGPDPKLHNAIIDHVSGDEEADEAAVEAARAAAALAAAAPHTVGSPTILLDAPPTKRAPKAKLLSTSDNKYEINMAIDCDQACVARLNQYAPGSGQVCLAAPCSLLWFSGSVSILIPLHALFLCLACVSPPNSHLLCFSSSWIWPGNRCGHVSHSSHRGNCRCLSLLSSVCVFCFCLSVCTNCFLFSWVDKSLLLKCCLLDQIIFSSYSLIAFAAVVYRRDLGRNLIITHMKLWATASPFDSGANLFTMRITELRLTCSLCQALSLTCSPSLSLTVIRQARPR